MQGESAGFAWKVIDDESGKPELCYMFGVGEILHMPNPCLPGKLFPQAYIAVKDCSLNCIAELEGRDPTKEDVFDTSEETQEATRNQLISSSMELQKLVRSTRFRRQTRQRQLKLIDDLVSRAEEDTGIIGAGVLVEPVYVYQRYTNPEGHVGYQAFGMQGIAIAGTCLALGMLGRESLDRRAIRRDIDLVVPNEGYCMTIAIEAVYTAGPITGPEQLVQGSIVDLPIHARSGELTFFDRND